MYNSQALFCFRVFCRYMHTLTLLFSLFRLSFLRHFCSFSRTLSRQTTLLHAQLIHLHPPTHTQPNIHQTTFLLDTFPHSAWLVLRVRYSTCDWRVESSCLVHLSIFLSLKGLYFRKTIPTREKQCVMKATYKLTIEGSLQLTPGMVISSARAQNMSSCDEKHLLLTRKAQRFSLLSSLYCSPKFSQWGSFSTVNEWIDRKKRRKQVMLNEKYL